MNTEALLSFYEKDLKRLITEIELYTNEENIWKVENSISNSVGNLVLHLIGNLNTFIGKEIGHTNYVRNRELEFTQKNIPRKELIENVNKTIQVVKESLINLTEEDMKKDYPFLKFEEKTSNEYLLVHLIAHLSYHLGQINYHRRMLDV